MMTKKERARSILARLEKEFPDSKCALDFDTPFQLLIATILSAQCTDKRVNIVTKTLFDELPNPKSMSQVHLNKLMKLIRSTGFYRNKAINIKKTSQKIMEEFNGKVPQNMEDLITLPGVARKTANVVLFHGFGISEGIAVDTHVLRITNLWKLTKFRDAVRVEKDLLKIIPRERWGIWTNLVIDHGRKTCIARRPKCQECFLTDLCPSAKVKVK